MSLEDSKLGLSEGLPATENLSRRLMQVSQ